jgi:hypothetical protein
MGPLGDTRPFLDQKNKLRFILLEPLEKTLEIDDPRKPQFHTARYGSTTQ